MYETLFGSVGHLFFRCRRRNVKITSSPFSSYFNPSENAYIILKSVTFSLEKEWPTLIPDYLDNDELSYIRDTLLNTFIQEHNQSMGKSKIIQKNSEENDNEYDNKTSSLSSSSLPTARFLRELFEENDLNKSE